MITSILDRNIKKKLMQINAVKSVVKMSKI